MVARHTDRVTTTGFRWPIRVYYEDTDAGGVVYHANYLRFMERARTEWLRQLGFEQDRLLAEEGVLFAVRAASLEYLRPARFNECLQVGVAIETRGRASLSFIQRITREPDEELIVDGRVKIACLQAEGLRPYAIPQRIIEVIEGVG